MSLPRFLPWHAATWNALRALSARGVHAVLLHGLRGIGKKSVGFDFAQSLLCERRGNDGLACRRCPACLMMEVSSHPDFRFVVPDAMAALKPGRPAEEDDVEPETEGVADSGEGPEGKPKRASREIRIDQVRALGSWATIATHRGGTRVALLAPAELLNAAAANALLKLLEEPPAATVFLLTSDAIDEVTPTIRSRCVLVRVERPAPAESLAWLAEQGIDDPASALAAAGGAPIAALEEHGSAAANAEGRKLLLDLLARGTTLTAAEVAHRIPRDIVLAPALGVIQRWCVDLLLYRAAGRVQYHPRHQATIAHVAANAHTERLWEWLRSLGRLQSVRDHPLNGRLVVEAMMLEYLATLSEKP